MINSLSSRKFLYKSRIYRARLFLATKWLGYAFLFLVLIWGVYPRNFSNIQSFVASYIDRHFDFRIQTIILDCDEEVKASKKIRKILDKYRGGKFSFTENDIALAIRSDIQNMNWVKDIQVKLVSPDTLRVSVKYKEPKAILVQSKKLYLVDMQGFIIERIRDKHSYDLIYLIGQDANLKYRALLSKVQGSEVFSDIETLTYIGKFRWNIQLKNNVTIKLPSANIDLALKLLQDIKQKKYLEKNVSMIDLRLIPSKIYIK